MNSRDQSVSFHGPPLTQMMDSSFFPAPVSEPVDVWSGDEQIIPTTAIPGRTSNHAYVVKLPS